MDRTTTRIAAILSSLLVLGACSEDENGRIVIGRGFEQTTLNTDQYQLPVVVQVSDINGTPQSGAIVTITARPDGYFKGAYQATDIDNPPNGVPDEWQINPAPTFCTNEDANSNGILDGAEDTNTNGVLDPAGAVTISSHPSELPTVVPATNTLITDNTGFGYFSLVYPKSQSNWVQVTLTARVGDGSPGNTQTDTFVLPVLRADLDDTSIIPPGGTNSPYGIATDCTNQN